MIEQRIPKNKSKPFFIQLMWQYQFAMETLLLENLYFYLNSSKNINYKIIDSGHFQIYLAMNILFLDTNMRQDKIGKHQINLIVNERSIILPSI